MYIAQISDLYIAPKNDETANAIKMVTNLKKCIAHINKRTVKPDLVLITGNITNNGSVDACIHARELLDQLDCTYKLVPGPNDDRRITLSIFEHACANEVGGVLSYVVNDYPLRLIGLDSMGHNGTGGFICPKRQDWLYGNLAEMPSQATLIFMHHSPINLGVSEIGEEPLGNALQLGQIISSFTNIKGIICGHVNFASHTSWHGTVISTAPSMGIPLAHDSVEDVDDAPAYNMHHFTKNEDLVSRTIYLRRC